MFEVMTYPYLKTLYEMDVTENHGMLQLVQKYSDVYVFCQLESSKNSLEKKRNQITIRKANRWPDRDPDE